MRLVPGLAFLIIGITLLFLMVRRWCALIRPAREFRPRRADAGPRPRHPRRKPDWVVKEVIRLKAAANLSCHKLAATFNRLHAAERGMTVGKTWVANTVRSHRHEIEAMRKAWKRGDPRSLSPNAVWGIDLTGKGDRNGLAHPILGIVDHGSRLALCIQPLPDKRTITLLRAILTAIEQFGPPRQIRTDNESMFRSRLFRWVIHGLGIRHRYSQPGMPWQNGRIERLFGTLKNKLDQLEVAGFDSLKQALDEFGFWYNAVRPHQHLRGLTPLEAWHGIDPYRRPAKASYLFSAWDGLLEGVYLRR